MIVMGIIYYCLNKINGKGYVGQTISTLNKRKADHYGYDINDGTIFHKAILKYGKDNFEWSILGEYPNEELDEWETYWIKEKNTFFRNNKGYNMTLGGTNNAGSESLKKRIRAYQIDKNGEIYNLYYFDSIAEASRFLTKHYHCCFNQTLISGICNRKKGFHTHHNFTFDFVDELNNNISKEHKRGSTSAQKVQIIDIQNNSLFFNSKTEAARYLKVQLIVLNHAIERGGLITRGKLKGWKVILVKDFLLDNSKAGG